MNIEDLLSHADFIRALARSLVVDEHQAADIEQQAWLAALKSPPDRDKPVRSWFSAVVRNFARRAYRDAGRRRKHEGMVDAIDSKTPPSPYEIVSRSEIGRSLLEEVLRLRDPYRTTILYRFYEDMPPRDIAGHLGIPVDRVRTHLKRGIAKLRERLDAKHGGDRKKWVMALAPVAGMKLGSGAAVAGAGTAFTGALTMYTYVKLSVAAAVLIGLSLSLYYLFSGKPPDERVGFSAGHAVTDPMTGMTADHGEDLDSSNKRNQEDAPSRSRVEAALNTVTIDGFVLTRPGRKAVEGARVVVDELPFREGIMSLDGRTGSDGRFSLKCPVREGRDTTGFHVRVSADRCKEIKTVLPYQGHEILDCGTIYLDGNEEYVVEVTDTSGEPVPGARMSFLQEFGDEAFIEKVADSQGRIRVTEQELDLKKWAFMGIRVQAAGMADYLYFKDIDDDGGREVIPERIVMEQAGTRSSRIVDKATKQGIAGAKVDVEWWVLSWNRPISSVHRETDEDGRFDLPLTTLTKDIVIFTKIYADGYQGYDECCEGKYPSQINVKRMSKFISCLAVDSRNRECLPNLKISVNRMVNVFTDEKGFFNLSWKYSNDKSIYLYAPEEKLFFRSKINLKEYENKLLVIPFEEAVLEKLKVVFQDGLGKPVVGAFVEMKYDPDECCAENYFCNTDTEGNAVFDIRMAEPIDVSLAITCEAFGTTEFGPFRVGAEEVEPVRRLVLDRGTLFQNLRIVDENGGPVARKTVIADLTMEDRTTRKFRGESDEDGLCDLTIPPFIEGTLYVEERPDTVVFIDYDALLERRWINLVLYRNVAPNYVIEGIVTTASGEPLKGVYIQPSITSGSKREINWTKSRKDGSFRFPVFENEIFSLSIGSTLHDGSWFTAEERTGLRAGTKLEISMTPSSGVMVKLDKIWRKYRNQRSEYETWLEAEDGRKIEAAEIRTTSWMARYIGIPEGRMRAVIVTSDGARHQSELFQVRAGKSAGTVEIEG